VALSEGQSVPLFSLPDADMEMFDLASVLGSHHVVLYFYPRDNTPACTRQAIDFSDHDADFAKQKCIVVGISPDDCLTHAEFRDQHGLSVELLADEDGDVCKLFGVWLSGQVEGVTKRSVRRSTFIISRDGVLRHVMHDVNPRGHAAEVFQLVKQLNSRNVNGNRQEHSRHA